MTTESVREYIPKGGMCRVCKRKDLLCNDAPFESMPVLQTFDDLIVVRCTWFERQS